MAEGARLRVELRPSGLTWVRIPSSPPSPLLSSKGLFGLSVAMNSPTDTTENECTKLDGLWANSRDSFVHALDHFSSLRNERSDFHNKKWIILSVHHAAEVFGNFLLTTLDPEHPRDKRSGKPFYPSLRLLIKQLVDHPRWSQLTAGERRLISEFLPPLCDDRDALMHRIAPADLTVAASAIALLGLLHVVRRRVGEEADEFLTQWSPVGDVVDALHWRDFDRYHQLIEQLVLEYYSSSLLDQCPYCGAYARIFGTDCEACFSEEARKEPSD